jgi:hypothetical protein
MSGDQRLPRRDFVILPLLCLLTVCIMLGAAEVIADRFFDESGAETCSVLDPLHGYRIRPNCSSWRKAAEGPRVENTYNDCGYRSRESCAPPPPGTVRVATLGASTAQGMKVAQDEILTARLGRLLSAACHRPVEFQNMGVPGYKPLDQYLRVDEALAMAPDIVMLVIVPFDLEGNEDPNRIANRDHPELLVRPQVAAAERTHPLFQQINDALSGSRAVVAAEHFLYQDRATYVRLFLKYGDKADYLRLPLSTAWERRLRDLEILLGGMADKIHAAGKPFVVVLGPQLIQVALLNPADRPNGVDPFAIGRRFKEIADRHGILFVNALDYFRTAARPESLFYAVDGHMTGDGYAVVAKGLAHDLPTSGLKPFARCTVDKVAGVDP